MSLKEEKASPLVNNSQLGSGAHSVSGASHRALSTRKGSHVYAGESLIQQNQSLLANARLEPGQRSKSLVRGLESGRSR